MKVTAGKKDKRWANRVLHLFCFLGLIFDHVAGSNAGRYKLSIHGNLTSRTFRTETVQFYSFGSSMLLTNHQDDCL